MRNVLRYGSLGLAATLLISACTPAMTAPPAEGPAAPTPLAPAAGEFPEDLAPEFPSDVQPLQLAPEAPQPPLTVNDQRLVLPTGGNVSLDQLYQDLPASIPQDEASEWLGPMPGAIPQGFGQPGAIGPGALGPGGYGAFPGAIPELLTYNALARCLYFRYLNFYIPYYLVGNAYYPYAYSPYYNPGLRGLYAYPIFYGYGDYCYPYTFLSSSYRYGYPDWEYYWPLYRSRFTHHYDDDFRSYRRHWGRREFHGWLDNRRRDRNHENWRERAREHRRGDRPGNHGNRPGPDWNDRPGNHGNRPGPDWNDRPGNHGNRPGPDWNDRPGNHGNRPGPDGNDRPGKHDRPDRDGGKRDGDRPNRGGESHKQRGDEHRGKGSDGERKYSRGEGQQVRRGGEQQARQHERRDREPRVARGNHESRKGGDRGGRGDRRRG